MRNLKKPILAVLAAAVVVSSIGIGSADARSRRDRNNAAAAAAMIGIVGTIAAIAAADSRRDRYYDDGYRYRGRAYRNGRAYRGGHVYAPGYRSNPGYPVRNGLLPNNLPVGNDPLNADPYGR